MKVLQKYCDTISYIFFPSFFYPPHTYRIFFFFLFFFSSTHVPLHFSFFTSFFFCNLPLPPNSITFQLSFFLFFFFFLSPFSLALHFSLFFSTSFLPLLKIYPYSFLFFPSFLFFSFTLFCSLFFPERSTDSQSSPSVLLPFPSPPPPFLLAHHL